MIYLLDTNTWIVYLRQTDAALVQKIQRTNPADLRLCSVVLGELYYGAFRGSPAHQPHNLGLLAQLCASFVSVSFDDMAAEEYGRIRADLAARGMLIGPNDLMIAAIARAHRFVLVTHNTAEFSRVAGLTLEDWLVPAPGGGGTGPP
jgi:tRNA(fMet)-specific endonuclease VapC